MLNVDCTDTAYSEVTDDIEQLKQENAALATIEQLNIQSDSSVGRTNFDLQITDEQLAILASEAEQDTGTGDVGTKLFSKKTYCAKGGSYYRYPCPYCRDIVNYIAPKKQFKARCYAISIASAIYYFPKGVDSLDRGSCGPLCNRH